MYSKKGLSDVITTVLIILLALAAVVIIWQFIKPAIENTGPEIQCRTKCVSVTVSPASCIKNANGNYNVTVKNDGSDPIKSTKLILVNSNAETNVTEGGALTAFGTNAVNNFYFAGGAKEFKVAPVVALDDGTSCTCDASKAIPCS